MAKKTDTQEIAEERAAAQSATAVAEVTDEQHDKNRIAFLELELEEQRRANERLRVETALASKRAAAPQRAPSNEESDPLYNPEGDADELIRVEAIKTGTYYDVGNPMRPEWYQVKRVGRKQIGGVLLPGHVFMMRRADVNTAIYQPAKALGWVRVLRHGEEVRADQPISAPAPQTTQQAMRVRGTNAGNILPIGG
jgi:hypothetical protein